METKDKDSREIISIVSGLHQEEENRKGKVQRFVSSVVPSNKTDGKEREQKHTRVFVISGLSETSTGTQPTNISTKTPSARELT